LCCCISFFNFLLAIIVEAAMMRGETPRPNVHGVAAEWGAVSVIGAPVRRCEDYRFLTGQGTYTDDINRPGQLHAYILRSPHANARITGIDISSAASAPGV